MAKTVRRVKEYKILLHEIPDEDKVVGSSVYDKTKENEDVLIGIIMDYDPATQHALIELIDSLPEDRVVKAGGLPVRYTA